MKTAKLFKNGQGQTMRHPKEFRFEDEINWDDLFAATEGFSVDFMLTYSQPPVQARAFKS